MSKFVPYFYFLPCNSLAPSDETWFALAGLLIVAGVIVFIIYKLIEIFR